MLNIYTHDHTRYFNQVWAASGKAVNQGALLPESVARMIFAAATNKRSRLRYVIGKNVNLL